MAGGRSSYRDRSEDAVAEAGGGSDPSSATRGARADVAFPSPPPAVPLIDAEAIDALTEKIRARFERLVRVSGRDDEAREDPFVAIKRPRPFARPMPLDAGRRTNTEGTFAEIADELEKEPVAEIDLDRFEENLRKTFEAALPGSGASAP